jgi:hypothetical protein
LNVTEYTSLINNPNAINDIQSINLEKIVQEFPYFQSARALYLKGLYNQNSFKYNYALKITAAHTTDRSVLFDFITSETFTTIQKGLYDKKVAELLDITVKESEIFVDGEPRLEPRVNTIEESILTTIKNASPSTQETEEIEEVIAIEDNKPEIIEPIKQEKSEEIILEKLELGKPLEFLKSEKHSFHEWLQLSKFQPIVRDEKKADQENPSEVDFEKQKKNRLIDTFIKTNPKIPPIKQDATPVSIVLEPSSADNSYLMT